LTLIQRVWRLEPMAKSFPVNVVVYSTGDGRNMVWKVEAARDDGDRE
jgi:hypothetical protein